MSTDLTLPEPNIPLLRKAVEWAEAEAAKPDGTCMWNQSFWATETDCGTAFCIAGYVVETQLGGALLDKQLSGDYYAVEIDGVRGGPELWQSAAQSQLGITETEASRLFAASNDIEDVRRFADRIAARAGDRL